MRLPTGCTRFSKLKKKKFSKSERSAVSETHSLQGGHVADAANSPHMGPSDGCPSLQSALPPGVDGRRSHRKGLPRTPARVGNRPPTQATTPPAQARTHRDRHLIVVQNEGRVDASELRDGGHGAGEC